MSAADLILNGVDSRGAGQAGDVFVVTVTYGDRRAFLEQVIAAIPGDEVAGVVVVDNGAHWDVRELEAAFPTLSLKVIQMGRNTGSANGFTAGIEAALEAGADSIWLLDDDNLPRPGALRLLRKAHDDVIASGVGCKVAVLACRPERLPKAVLGTGVSPRHQRHSDFLGFHLFDVPRKVWHRLQRTTSASAPASETFDLPAAPYSGLLLHRNAIEAIGMPRWDFVLYMDDTEWSSRLVRLGGRIVLVTKALVEDLESSWNIRGRASSRIGSLLCGEGDFRAYYSTRNAAYLSTRDSRLSAVMWCVNKWLYLLLLWVVATVRGRRARYALLRRAVRDGEAGRLGLHPEYPL